MKKLLVYLALLLCMQGVRGQGALIEKADVHYDFFQYKEAIEAYEAALTKANPKYEKYIIERLVQCYKFSFQYAKAEEYFRRLVRMGDNTDPEIYIDYGNILKINGKYEEAKEQFRYYSTIVKEDPYADFLQRSLAWAIKYQDSVRNFTVLPTNLDITGQSLGYAFFDDGLIYSHGRNKPANGGMPVFDLEYARIIDSVTFADDEKIMAELLFDLNEGSPSLTPDGTLMYFAVNATKVKKGETRKVGNVEISSDGVANFKIYAAQLVNGVFTNPQELPFNNKEYNCLHPCVTDDGASLYFASDMPGGSGGLDLYIVTRKEDGTWGKPRNLGNKVNTMENELYPFVSNGFLYFASKGFNGYGGYDLYQSKLVFGLPGPPNNLGKPFNSAQDDVAFVCRPSGRSGYFSSNRGNGEGIDKVYYFRDNSIEIRTITPPPVAVAKKDAGNDGKPNTPSKKPVASASKKPVAAKPTPKPTDSASTALLNPVSAPVESASVRSAPPAATLKISDDELVKLAFENVQFGFNEYKVQAGSHESLDSAARAAKLSRTVKINVTAHTDCVGSDAYNVLLSAKRASAVKAYLVSKGIPASRVITVAKGESEPLSTCGTCESCSEDDHRKNRRVVVRIVR